MKIKWVIPHYSLPPEVEGIDELKQMGLVCMYMDKSLTGADEGDRGLLSVFVTTNSLAWGPDSGIHNYHLFGVEIE